MNKKKFAGSSDLAVHGRKRPLHGQIGSGHPRPCPHGRRSGGGGALEVDLEEGDELEVDLVGGSVVEERERARGRGGGELMDAADATFPRLFPAGGGRK